MFICWSVKGGVGTSTFAASLALASAETEPTLLVDLADELPSVLGVDEAGAPGVFDWLGADGDVPPEALRRLELPVSDSLALLPSGDRSGPFLGDRAQSLATVLAASSRRVVVDAGCWIDPDISVAGLLAEADDRLLVTRPCYLALRRQRSCSVEPTGVVLIDEEGRSLRRHDVAEVVGAPVIAAPPLDPAVARAVDAGLLGHRVPRSLARSCRRILALAPQP